MARILFCCINGTGLGHVTRTLAIARHVRRLEPDSEILFLTSSENTQVLWREGFTSIKVPSIEVLKADRRLPVIALAHAAAAQTVAIFRPDLVVTESQPGGVFHELISPILSVPRRVFVFGMFPNYFENSAYRMAFGAHDRILMPYREEEREAIKINIEGTVDWVGDILVRSSDEILPREDVRRRLGIPSDALVFYVALGGGGNPRHGEILAWVVDSLAEFPEITVARASPPLSKETPSTGAAETWIPINHYPAMEYFSAFDAAISSSGFNCAELVYAGVPTVWVPLGFPSTDQEFNAERLAGRGFGVKVEALDGEALKAAVDKLLDAKYRQDMSDRMQEWAGPNGAEAAARVILDYIANDPGSLNVL